MPVETKQELKAIFQDYFNVEPVVGALPGDSQEVAKAFSDGLGLTKSSEKIAHFFEQVLKIPSFRGVVFLGYYLGKAGVQKILDCHIFENPHEWPQDKRLKIDYNQVFTPVSDLLRSRQSNHIYCSSSFTFTPSFQGKFQEWAQYNSAFSVGCEELERLGVSAYDLSKKQDRDLFYELTDTDKFQACPISSGLEKVYIAYRA